MPEAAAAEVGDIDDRIAAAVAVALSPVMAIITAQQETIRQLTEQTRLLTEQVDAQSIGLIGKGKHERWIRAMLTRMAERLAPLEREVPKDYRTHLENNMRFAVDFFGPIETLPSERLSAVQRHLFGIERQWMRRVRRRGKDLAKTAPPAQIPLTLVHDTRPTKPKKATG